MAGQSADLDAFPHEIREGMVAHAERVCSAVTFTNPRILNGETEGYRVFSTYCVTHCPYESPQCERKHTSNNFVSATIC